MDFNLITYNPFKEPSQHTNGRWVLSSMEFNLIAHDPLKNLVNIPMGVGFLVHWMISIYLQPSDATFQI